MTAIKSLCAALLLLMPVGSLWANAEPSPFPEDLVTEVYVLSFDVEAGDRASLVVRPCEPDGSCKATMVRVDERTLFKSDGRVIPFAAARKLDWKFAAISVNKFKVATEISRIVLD